MATLTQKIVEEKGWYNVKKLTAKDLQGYDKIGEIAFQNCGLIEIELPEGVTEIEKTAFNMCSELERVKLPTTLKTIGFGAFAWCHSLEEIDIPSRVDTIGCFAFGGCEILKKVTLHNGLFYLHKAAFQDCYNLKQIELPDSLVYIGQRCFYNCDSLHNIIVKKKRQIVTYKAMNKDMTCFNGFQYEVGKTYEIPAEQNIAICWCGFHSCYNPFDCFNYYYGFDNTDIVICKCVIEGDRDTTNDKVASRKITILQKFNSFADAFNDYFAECAKINA